MGSRYPTTLVVDYCYNPIHVVDDDKDIIVPCGKCDGCLLHKANEWSMRCGMEIEDTPVTIFGTLTYSNKYIPKLIPVDGYELVTLGNVRKDGFRDLMAVNKRVWISDNYLNIRFNGFRDVHRQDGIVINRNYSHIDLQHWDNKHFPTINYASKRDIQLWLKLIRKDLDENGIYKNERVLQRGPIRYFIISEVGPTTCRNHYHFLFFCQSQEVASYLLEGSLYENWKMCDADRFYPYCHICDSGARGYVTQYLTCTSKLPVVYRENKEIRPFRLASKSPAIGFIGQDKEKIFKDVSQGIIKYCRKVPRLESTTILEYPKNFLISLFPKCYRFNKITDSRRFNIYSYLYRAVRENGCSYFILRSRLSKILNASDYLATCACYRFCKEYVDSPLYYYYLLDTYYYKVEMEHLRNFYLSQSDCNFKESPYKLFEYYPNIEQWFLSEPYNLRPVEFLSDFGFDIYKLIDNKEFFTLIKKQIFDANYIYRKEVESIQQDMIKMSKFNEVSGCAPTIV